jgi:ABC-type transporter Mla MlaB component
MFEVWGPIVREDIPGLCDRVCALFAEHAPRVAFCDVATVAPDAVTLEALARLQLVARRRGCQVRLRDASPALLELVAFTGLTDVLPE